MLEGTGSRIDAEGLALYTALIRDRAHVTGTLAKMAAWRLEALHRDAAAMGAPVSCSRATGTGRCRPGSAATWPAACPTRRSRSCPA